MQTLQAAMFLGLGAVAVWLHVRYPRLRPRNLVFAIVHVGASFGIFSLLPYAIDLCRELPGRSGLPVFVVGFMIPGLFYVLLSWLWLMVKIHDLANRTPRGGHRVRNAPARAGA